MRLRKQVQRVPEAEDPGTPDPQAEATENRATGQPGIGADATSSDIADGALTRERHFVEGTHPLSEREESTPAKPSRRREGKKRRGRGSEAGEPEGLTEEVYSRLSKYRMTAELQARQESRREEREEDEEEEPWRKK